MADSEEPCIKCGGLTYVRNRFEEGDLPCHDECYEDLCADAAMDSGEETPDEN